MFFYERPKGSDIQHELENEYKFLKSQNKQILGGHKLRMLQFYLFRKVSTSFL